MVIKAILFDLDGVLVDACDWHYHALNTALKKIVGYEIEREEHLKTFNGLSTNRKLNMLGIPDKQKQDIWRLKQESTIEYIEKYAQPSSQKELLHCSLLWEGYETACVTNAIRKTAELMLEKTNQLRFMKFVLTNEDVDLIKPHPECYQKAMKKLGVNPKETLIVEDSEKGKKAAYASGAYVLEVKDSSEVNWPNIKKRIDRLSGKDILEGGAF